LGGRTFLKAVCKILKFSIKAYSCFASNFTWTGQREGEEGEEP
jgi:hypothetical protein